MSSPVQPIGVTLVPKEGQASVPIYQDEQGIETFEVNEPYVLMDGRSLSDPIPVVVNDGSVAHDLAGNPLQALGVKVLPGGNTPDPIPEYTLGPLDIVIEETGLTSMGGEFELATHAMTLGVVCYFTGTINQGEIQATHGGEPLELVRMDRHPGGVLTAIFYGNGLTIEQAELRVFTTSSDAKLGPALMRMRDDLGYPEGVKTIWNAGDLGYSSRTTELTPSCTASGTVLTAMGVLSYREGSSIILTGNHPEMTTGLRGRVLSGDFEPLDHNTFQSDYWIQKEPGVFHLEDAGLARTMTLDVNIEPNVATGLRFDYSAPSEGGISVFYLRPNGSFVNMAANSGVDRRWYLPLPPSTTGYVRLRFQASNTATLKDIQLIRNPFGIYGNLTMARGQNVNDAWRLYGLSLNPERYTISSFAVDGL